MRLMSTSKGQFGEQGSRLIVDGVPIPVTIRINGSGYRPVINVFDCLAENSVPGTWVPSKILRQITPVSFRLALPANYRITFHVSLLKPAGGSRGVEDQEEAGKKGAPPIIIDGEEVYRVQEVLDSCRRGRVLQYLVDWEGYGPEERSWVNAEDILDPSLTIDFHRAHPDKPAPRPRGRPRRCLPLRVGSHSQGGGSVTNQASVAPSDHHQRDPSPEY